MFVFLYYDLFGNWNYITAADHINGPLLESIKDYCPRINMVPYGRPFVNEREAGQIKDVLAEINIDYIEMRADDYVKYGLQNVHTRI